MHTTGIFTIHKVRIPCKFNQSVQLVPFGDIHRDNENCHEEKWQEFLEWGRKQRGTYWLGMGDYLDFASTSERSILQDGRLHESTSGKFNAMVRDDIKRFAKEIGFMKGRLLGMIEGNHYFNMPEGITSTQYLCQMMECKYLGCMSLIRLLMCPQYKVAGQIHKVDLCVHHGFGAARMIGGSINSVQKLIDGVQADGYFCGHDHRRNIGIGSRLELVGGHTGPLELAERRTLFIRTGSFLRGYVDGKPSYVCDAAMPPSDLGVVNIFINLKRKMMTRTKDANGKVKRLSDVSLDLHASV